MIEELNGKKLLILGGSLWRDAIYDFCKLNGIFIIAAGNDPNAGICDIADEYYNINSTDSETMIRFINEKQIDGIYMGGSEPVITAASAYINELGFPCYCNTEQWNALQNKVQFKKMCEKVGLPVAKQYEDICEIKDAEYPVVTKPVDGCGSRGFTICYNQIELKNGYNMAQKSSSTNQAIIEQYVPNDGIVVLYTVSAGKLIFSAIEDKYPICFNSHGTFVGGLFDFESNLKKEFRSLFEDKIQSLVNILGIREGNFWIEVFHNLGQYYFNEAGFRYGGSGTLYPINYLTAINQAATDIYYSLTGKSKIIYNPSLFDDDVCKGKRYAIYPIFLKPGVIESVEGTDVLLQHPCVLKVLLMKKERDNIPDDGSFGQCGALVHIIYDSISQLRETLFKIHEVLVLKDENGENMLLQMLNINDLVIRSMDWR